MLAASDVLGELDSIQALAVGSSRYGWVAPTMTDDNVLHIQGGRHPLQELVVPTFVSNECYMSGGNGCQANAVGENSPGGQGHSAYPSTLILTGPNHSGKSVYLKQVALIVYLAHIGCFVPAEQATIGITDRILTRITTRESVARNESAFAIDLRQAAFAINFATRRSLVIVDEFGKGTNAFDGAGLMTALIQHFADLGPERPKLLVATHFHEVFESGVLGENDELAFAHMDVHVDFETPTRENQVTHLFKIKPGRSVSSFGSRCAAMNGVDESVVERAEAIMLLLVRGEDVEAACAKLSPGEEARLQQAEAVARAFLAEDIPRPTAAGAKRVDDHDYRAALERILSVQRPE
jgi:DNA mismatch repair protein MSH5